MGRAGKIARRSFLIGSAALVGGVAFGWYQYRKELPNPLQGQGLGALTPYVLIDASGVTVIAPRAEMGQGTHTTLAALVAEELDLDWSAVRVLHGPPAQAYYNGSLLREGVPFAPLDQGWLAETARDAMDVPARFLGLQVTGGSTSIPDGFEKMRLAGAVARLALIRAAARRSGLVEADLRTEGGRVLLPDGASLSYAELAVEAAAVELPDPPELRPSNAWKLLGKSLPRTDMAAKSDGSARYACDVRLPGMVFATVRRNPAPGAALLRFDAKEALAFPGGRDVLPLENGFAAVAESSWAAMQALDLVQVEWAAPDVAVDEALIAADLRAALDGAPEATAREQGEISAPEFEAEYSVPHQAHATMEPMGAAAWLQDGRLQLWAGTQFPTMALAEAAKAAGVAPDAVEFHTEFMGGGFGRRAEMDFIRQAASLAKALSPVPVLLSWSREEDMAQDMYRPAAMARVRASVADGAVSQFHLATAAGSIIESLAGRFGFPALGPDSSILQGAGEQPYDFPNYLVTGHRAETRVPLGFWRSVGNSQNAFFHDCALDELAHLAGVDPLLFRMRQMTHLPSIQVLEAAAEISNWGATAPGRAKGVGFCYSFGVPVAEVVEVEDTPQGIRLTGAWIAADPGIALDPSIIEAQLSGGMVFGLSAAMQGAITFAQGRVEQSNFWDYEPMRMRQCPPITVKILQSGGEIRGIGEPGTPPAAPALANAIFALTGKRIRHLPLNREVRFA
ncbi:molybdopterin-dependent oxidoreductase [Xinfangfangia sp. CPCC 101601]|uniref:Molybdopterin-dependent oxidoreductase n=1 Tax=Pseudogemmobacter lacusdianii TaxID=3069608 RepID=A0ABU0VUD4_9RHOB|nr:molybdopterin cofactor-binding domain-containing protein [Xinfangfangia sp. CPCC 101601]MDQ2065339.1 molybdopterin-dependent oxidoreductase [Xinfangfangia sp. CPCC 101601]